MDAGSAGKAKDRVPESPENRLGQLGVTQGGDPRGLEAEPGEHREWRFPRSRLVRWWLAETKAELLASALLQDQA